MADIDKRKLVKACCSIGVQAGAGVLVGVLVVKAGCGLAKAVGGLLRRRKVRFELKETTHASAADTCSEPVPVQDEWKALPSSEPLPQPQQGSTLVAQALLPLSINAFHERFLSGASSSLQDHHMSCGEFDFSATRWEKQAGGGLTRTFEFTQPKTGMMLSPAQCVQRQVLSLHQQQGETGLALRTSMHMLNIPYKECFTVESLWLAQPTSSSTTQLSIHVRVPFSRPCIMRGIIQRTAMKDSSAFFASFVTKVAEEPASTSMGGADGSVHVEVNLRGGKTSSSGNNNSASASKPGTEQAQQYPGWDRSCTIGLMLMLLMGLLQWLVILAGYPLPGDTGRHDMTKAIQNLLARMCFGTPLGLPAFSYL